MLVNTTQDFVERPVCKPSACRHVYLTTSENHSICGSLEGSAAPEQLSYGCQHGAKKRRQSFQTAKVNPAVMS